MQEIHDHCLTGPRTTLWIPGLAWLIGCCLLLGCASTNVTDEHAYEGSKLPKPARIIVHDFAATPGDLPAWSQAASAFASAGVDMSPEQLEAGRKLGADVAKELVDNINKTGMTAVRSEGQPPAQLHDIELVGYFTTVDKGSAAERVLIGFGKGGATVGVHAEGYHMTEGGMELLGSGNVDSGGGKSPGLVVPTLVTIATHNPIGLAVSGALKVGGEMTGKSGAKGDAGRIADEIAKVLKTRMKEQGWI